MYVLYMFVFVRNDPSSFPLVTTTMMQLKRPPTLHLVQHVLGTVQQSVVVIHTITLLGEPSFPLCGSPVA